MEIKKNYKIQFSTNPILKDIIKKNIVKNNNKKIKTKLYIKKNWNPPKRVRHGNQWVWEDKKERKRMAYWSSFTIMRHLMRKPPLKRFKW